MFLLILPLSVQAGLAESDYQSYSSTKFASSEWNTLVQEGMKAFHSGDYDVAQFSLYKAFNKGCQSPIVLFMLALINEYKESYYSSLDFYKMAQKNFKKANKDHRYNKEFLENYGRAMYFSGKKKEALPLLKKAGKRSKSFWLLKLLGMLAYEDGDALNAMSYFERAVRVKDSDVTKAELVDIYSKLGKLFLYQGQKSGALRYYNQVLAIDPNNQEAKHFVNQINKEYEQQKMFNMFEKMQEM